MDMIDVGSVLQDRYEVTGRLASGGMADVFLALDRALERQVAVKVVRGTTIGQRERLEREARLLAGFEHPNLVRIYDAQHDGDDAYVVLEYIDGPTLAEVVRSGALEPARVALVGAEVADALAYIHARGVIHRDVKPSNVFVGRDGRTRLSDFGVARHEDDAQLTQTGMVIGTGAYMAPEQVSGGTVGPPADTYALGLVLLECLQGAPVFSGTASEAAMARLARDPDVRGTAVPAGWRPLLGAMTARDAASRPDASTVAAQLRALPLTSGDTQLLPAAPTTVTELPPPPAAGAPPHRLRQGVVAAFVTIAIGLLVLFALWRGSDDGATTDDTTTTTTVATTTTTKPTTTTSQCKQQQEQLDALDDQEKALDDQLKGKALREAKQRLEDQKKALENAMKSC